MLVVYLAHVMALRVFGRHSRVLRSQAPMLALIVGHTMIGLWILAQPVVASPRGAGGGLEYLSIPGYLDNVGENEALR